MYERKKTDQLSLLMLRWHIQKIKDTMSPLTGICSFREENTIQIFRKVITEIEEYIDLYSKIFHAVDKNDRHLLHNEKSCLIFMRLHIRHLLGTDKDLQARSEIVYAEAIMRNQLRLSETQNNLLKRKSELFLELSNIGNQAA